MFLGEYEHTLDDKNRLTLPARFREAFTAGCVVTREMDGCLYVYTPRLGALRGASARGPRPLHEGGPPDEPFRVRRRDRGGARQAGPHHAASGARRARKAEPRGRRRRRPRPRGDLGPRRPGASTSRKSKGVRSLLPNALQRSATDHVAVLAEEVRELLAVAPGETVVDATFGAGGHASLLAADLAGAGASSPSTAIPTPGPYFDRFTSRAGRTGALPARRIRHRPRPAGVRTASRPTRSSSTSASRACRSTGRSAASRTRWTLRSTCAWIRPPASLARDLVNEASERELADMFRRYGEERFAGQIARAHRAPPRRRSRSSARPSSWMSIRSAVPAPRRFGDGHPAKRVFQALRIAVNDELGALERALPAAVEMLRPGRPHRRHQLPLARGSDRQALPRRGGARLHLPAGLPVCVCGQGAALRLLTRKALSPLARARSDANPRSASARLRAAVRTEDATDGRCGRHGARPARPAPPAPACRRRRRPRAGGSPARGAASRPGSARGVIWIVVVAGLLAGIVAVTSPCSSCAWSADGSSRRSSRSGPRTPCSSRSSRAPRRSARRGAARGRLGLVAAVGRRPTSSSPPAGESG